VSDARVERYAELLLDTCLGVKRGWQVMVWSTPLARPLLEEVMKQLAERGAYPLLRLTFSGSTWREHRAWLRHAPLDVISEAPPIEVHARHQCDAWLGVSAPENTRDGADIPAERTSALEKAYTKAYQDAKSRPDYVDTPSVMCWYPTPALAQDAGMTLPAFADFLYGSCLIDWKSMYDRISRHAQLLDEAEEVRIVGDETDLRLSVAGRRADVDAGTGNMPGGEVFVCPVETSAEGTIAFTEFPAMRGGREIRGIRLRFSEGRVVDASADSEEDYLIETLDTDAGARRIGELGVGCNPGIDRYMRNAYFDEKMNGTVHLALGWGVDLNIGGTNESAIHWDIVKDLRSAGRIELDGKVVQENGVWVA
jgi:aminopeptidase